MTKSRHNDEGITKVVEQVVPSISRTFMAWWSGDFGEVDEWTTGTIGVLETQGDLFRSFTVITDPVEIERLRTHFFIQFRHRK